MAPCLFLIVMCSSLNNNNNNLELCGLGFRFFLYLCLFLCFYSLSFGFFLSFSFSLPVSPSASLQLQLVFLRRLYPSMVRLSSAGGSLSLVSTCSPLPPLVAFAIFVFFLLRSPSLPFFVSFPILRLLLLFWFSFSLSLSRAFSFSCLFSVIGNAVHGCLSVQFAFVCRILFLCSGCVFYVLGRGKVSCVVRFL